MSADFLYGAGEWLIGLLFLAFMLAAHELGFHLGAKLSPGRTRKRNRRFPSSRAPSSVYSACCSGSPQQWRCPASTHGGSLC